MPDILTENLTELVPDHLYTKKLKHHFLVLPARKTFNKLLSPNKKK